MSRLIIPAQLLPAALLAITLCSSLAIELTLTQLATMEIFHASR